LQKLDLICRIHLAIFLLQRFIVLEIQQQVLVTVLAVEMYQDSKISSEWCLR